MLVLAGEYRTDRIFAFVNAEDDPSGKGFQTLQMLIALGSGGVHGLGLGASRQKFFYVPGAHTDGIFAIIGEELGFIGAAIVIALFAFLMIRGFRVVPRARDDFGSLLAIGIVSWTAPARMVRAEFMSLRQREFVDAARNLGVSDISIIFREILPNALPPVIVFASVVMATSILMESIGSW